MIELNLTCEESKKILELGYDFSKICDFAWVTMNTNETPVLVCQNSEIQYLLFAQKIYDFQTAQIQKQPIEIIPVIPKAALEECLPDKLDVASLNNYVIVKNCVFVKNIDLKTISLSYFFEDYHSCYAEQIEFNSAYEAFIWCHEHHPEELRKKFEEVMG